MDKNKGMVRLVLGGSGYGKTEYVLKSVIKEAQEHINNNYIIVVPEQFTMETQKAIVDRHPNHGVLNIDIVSFNRLAFRVFEELGISNLSVLDDTGKTLILKRVIEENRDKLNIYKRKANQSGFVEEMKSAISELYSYGIDLKSFEDIMGYTKEKPYMGMKLKDIGLIYKAFKEALGEKYITKEEILKKLCQVIGKSQLIKNTEFFFDGFTGFTPVQEELLGILLENGRRLTVTVTISAEEAYKLTDSGFKEIKEQELFNLSKTTINKLYALAADRQVSIAGEDVIITGENKSYRYSEDSELSYIEKNIFRSNVSESGCDSSGEVRISALDNPIREAEAVAAYINKRVRNEGLRYRDFAIITGDLDTYRKLIETAFRDNDIPFFMDNKRRLIFNPCVNAIRQALLMVSDNFSYESVFGFLKCGISSIEREKIDLLENYVLEYGIRGFNRYSKSFTKFGRRLMEEELCTINDIREAFFDVIKEFKESVSGRDKTVRDYTNGVYELMERLDVYNILKRYEEGFKEEGRLSLAKEYEQTYGLLINLLDKLVELMGDTKINISEYAKLLDSGLEEIKVGVIPLNVDTVVIGDIQRTRLADIRELIVLGVNDGIIPMVSGKSGLFTGKDRSFLKEIGVELSPGTRENIFIQRFYLYQNLTKPADRLILTYSHTSASGKALRPSYLINTIKDMYTGKNSPVFDMREENIYTKELGVRYIAEHFSRNKEMTLLQKELFTYFYKDEEFKKKLMRVIEGADFSCYTGKIDEAVARALYGGDIVKSATRLERYAACGYGHFIMYGLKLAERRIYEISAADMGTMYHRVIELFSKEMKKEGLSFRTVSDEGREELLNRCMRQVEEGASGDVFFDTERNKYLLRRIREVSSKTIWAISEHIKAGNFEPEDFELSFSDGRVDRVDTLEQDGKCFIKIIDYKSGSKKFDMDEVMSGLQIQLIYYMGAVLDIEQKKRDSEIVPAGAFYFNIKSPYIERLPDSDNDDINNDRYRKALLEEYRQSGLVNSDSQVASEMDLALKEGNGKSLIIPIKAQEMNVGIGKSFMNGRNFNDIIEYVRAKTEKMCDVILSGDIDTNPYINKAGKTPCEYCSFKEICTFNEKYTGGRHRKINKHEPEEILDILRKSQKS